MWVHTNDVFVSSTLSCDRITFSLALLETYELAVLALAPGPNVAVISEADGVCAPAGDHPNALRLQTVDALGNKAVAPPPLSSFRLSLLPAATDGSIPASKSPVLAKAPCHELPRVADCGRVIRTASHGEDVGAGQRRDLNGTRRVLCQACAELPCFATTKGEDLVV